MIKLFNDSLNARYETLERNIKARSNSFYDSYLDLLESTIKYFLDESKINYDDSRTCGYIVRSKEVHDFLINELKLDDFTYNKLSDYIKKCNDHKHKKEKCLMVEGMINYLNVYFNLLNYYYDYIKESRMVFDSQYYVSIYGETERLNSEYKEELMKLKDELKESYENKKLSENDIKKYKELLSLKDIELLNLDEQNNKLQEQIRKLKDIKLNSMEEKLNKALEMLVNLNNEIQENRIAADAVYRSITGSDIKQAIEIIKKSRR